MSVTDLIIQTIYFFAMALKLLLFVRLLMSWFVRLGERSGFFRGLFNVVFSLTEPILAPIRKMLLKSPVGGVSAIVDFSPVLAYFLLELVSSLLMNMVAAIA